MMIQKIDPPVHDSFEQTTRCDFIEYPQVAVIIPAHNEEQSLPLVLRELPRVAHIIVVDNASTDATGRVGFSAGANVVVEYRLGYGSACLAGISWVRRMLVAVNNPPEIIVFLDGDFSDYPDDLRELVQPILSGEADFVLGSRLMGRNEPGSMPPQSVYGNKLACCLMHLFWGVRYTDLGPFRAITWEALESLEMSDTNFGWTVEMQIKAKIRRLRTVEIPVRYRKRVGVSKISGTLIGSMRAGYKILYTIFRYRWQTLWFR